jgi:hypothetical protein
MDRPKPFIIFGFSKLFLVHAKKGKYGSSMQSLQAMRSFAVDH